METVLIRADGLLLRPWCPGDAEAVHRACQDPALHRWLTGLPRPYRISDAAAFVGELAPRLLADGTALHLGVFAGDQLAGSVVLNAIDRAAGTAGLGYWSAPWARGHRVAERAGRALLSRAFGDPVRRSARTFGGAHPTLTAGELTLRPPTRRDVPGIVECRSDPETARWFGVPQPYTEEDARTHVDRTVPRRWARGVEAVFAIADAGDAYAGSVDLRIRTGDPGVAEVGFAVSPGSRGRGHAGTAVREICRWGFAELGLSRIEWRAEVGNDASRRVAEKAGFTVEGLLRQALRAHGGRRDCWVGSLLREAV